MHPSASEAPNSTVVLRPLGSPLGFGLGGLAVASLLMAGYDLGWVSAGDAKKVGLLLLVTVVPLQALASVFALLARDGAVAGAFALQTALWAATGASHMASAPGTTSPSLGLVQVAGGALIVLSGMAGARSKIVPGVAVALSGVHFAIGALYELGAGAAWQDASGIVGLAVVALAGYGAWAGELEEAGHPFAPLGRRGQGRAAVSAPFAAQVDDVSHEAGVRRQL